MFGHPTYAGLKPKSKDLFILGHPTHAGLKPVLPSPHPWVLVKNMFYKNQPKIGRVISSQRNIQQTK